MNWFNWRIPLVALLTAFIGITWYMVKPNDLPLKFVRYVDLGIDDSYYAGLATREGHYSNILIFSFNVVFLS